MDKRGVKKILILFAVFGLPVLFFAFIQKFEPTEKSLDRVGPLFHQAIVQYREENGQLPDSLPQLFPKFLQMDKIPEDIRVKKMKYWPGADGSDFKFGVPATLMDMWIWHGQIQRWEYSG